MFSGVVRAVLVCAVHDVSKIKRTQRGMLVLWRILCSYEAHAGLYHQLTACLIMWTSFMSPSWFGEDVRFLPPVEEVSPSLCLLGGMPVVWDYWSTLRQGRAGVTWVTVQQRTL